MSLERRSQPRAPACVTFESFCDQVVSYACALAVGSLQPKFVGQSFPSETNGALIKQGERVKLLLPELADVIIMRECSLRELVTQP